MFVRRAFLILLLIPGAVLGQSQPVTRIQELWPGVVINADISSSYSLTVFGVAELESPHLFRDSEYFAGLRISHPMSETLRIGIEYLQDRVYLADSALFLENRCSVDFQRRWNFSHSSTIYLQPKLELRKYGRKIDERLKLRGELLHELPAFRGTLRAYVEPAIDREFHGFEKVTARAGMFWPVGNRIKLEIFNAVVVAKRPDYNVEALGMVIFVGLRNRATRKDEINR